jgi:hypothetical protein
VVGYFVFVGKQRGKWAKTRQDELGDVEKREDDSNKLRHASIATKRNNKIVFALQLDDKSL